METLKKMTIVLAAVISAAMALTGRGGDSGAAAEKSADTTTAATESKPEESKPEESKEEEKKDEEKKDEEKKDDEKKEEEKKDDEKKDEEKKDDSASKEKPAKKGKSVVAKTQEEAPEPPAEEAAPDSVLVDAFANTVWVGMDGDYNVYALCLGDEEISFMSDDGSEINGYWGVVDGDPNIYIYNDSDLTDLAYTMPFQPDVDNNLLIINDTIVLTPTEASSVEEMTDAMEKESVACTIASYLDGTYWCCVGENSVEALSLKDGAIWYYDVSAEGEDGGNCYWSLDWENFTLYDENYNPLVTYGWDIEKDGSKFQLTLDGTNYVYTQVPESDAADIVNYLHSLFEDGGAAEDGEETEEAEEEE